MQISCLVLHQFLRGLVSRNQYPLSLITCDNQLVWPANCFRHFESYLQLDFIFSRPILSPVDYIILLSRTFFLNVKSQIYLGTFYSLASFLSISRCCSMCNIISIMSNALERCIELLSPKAYKIISLVILVITLLF